MQGAGWWSARRQSLTLIATRHASSVADMFHWWAGRDCKEPPEAPVLSLDAGKGERRELKLRQGVSLRGGRDTLVAPMVDLGWHKAVSRVTGKGRSGDSLPSRRGLTFFSRHFLL